MFELLRANLGHLSSCILRQQGLSARPAHALIAYYPGASAMSGLYADPHRDRELVRTVLLNHGFSRQEAEDQLAGRYQPQTLSCELRTLSSYVREQGLAHVDLLKVDVERAELDVLDGIEESDWPKIRQVVIDVHDEVGRAAAIESGLNSRGFRVILDQEEAMRGTAHPHAVRDPLPIRVARLSCSDLV